MIGRILILPEVNNINYWGHVLRKPQGLPDCLLEWHRCPMCAYTCPTVHGYSWHLYKAHNVRQPDRGLIYNTTCVACMREFWIRERLVTNVSRSSPKCRVVFRLYSCRMSDEDLASLEAEALAATKDLSASGRRRTHAALPTVRVAGPLLARAEEEGTLLKKRGRVHRYPEGRWPESPNYPAVVL